MIPQTGDLVRCIVDHYTSINRGEIRRVVSVDDYGNIVLRNRLSPNGRSTYCVWNFALYKRKSAIEAEWRKNMLHIALRINDCSFEEMASVINGSRDQLVHASQFMADTSQSALKERLKARVGQFPEERWLILSGNTVAETATPPVRFRAV